jgi:glycosyltransferase involved in cell wall biosynthesis
MRIAIFGTFYPLTQKTGNSTTGLTILLSRSKKIDSLKVVSQVGASLPRTIERPGVSLLPVWRHDDPPSLIKAFLQMVAFRRNVDAYLFNIHITSFGRSKLSNALGLTIVSLLARLARKPVLVYMHNFLSTQDPEGLGYQPNPLVVRAVKCMERVLIQSCRVVVPLASQRRRLVEEHGLDVQAHFLPYLEAIHPMLLERSQPQTPVLVSDSNEGAPFRLLLFGHWGPQKDLMRIVRVLAGLTSSVAGLRVTIAGQVNANFPEYEGLLDELEASSPPGRFDFVGAVPEDDLARLFRRHDVLLLPYSATGGYSGAMNAAAAFGIRIIAYDHEQLRETANLLGLEPTFISFRTEEVIASELRRAFVESSQHAPVNRSLSELLTIAQSAVDQLLDF